MLVGQANAPLRDIISLKCNKCHVTFVCRCCCFWGILRSTRFSVDIKTDAKKVMKLAKKMNGEKGRRKKKQKSGDVKIDVSISSDSPQDDSAANNETVVTVYEEEPDNEEQEDQEEDDGGQEEENENM